LLSYTFIDTQQEQMVLEAAGKVASKVLGCLMDGPAANCREEP